MKKVLAILMFSVLVFNSTVFAQKARSVRTKPVLQGESVVYGNAQAFSDGRSVWLEWQTVSETKNMGFFIYRQIGKTRTLVSEGIVGGTYLRAKGDEQTPGDKYTYFDPNGNGNAVYYVESFNTDGQRQLSNPIFPQYINDLKAVAGASSEVLRESKQKANSEIIKNDLILSKELKDTIDTNRLLPDLNMQRFLAGQPGVKIGVRKEGLYRVTKTELQNAGFDVNASPALWQLYVNGVEQSIIVANNGDFIEFYGIGMDTPESDTQIYYLIVGAQNGKRMGNKNLRPIGGNVLANSFPQTFTQKQRKIYFTNILNGDEENYFDNVPILTAGRTFTFNLSAVDFSVAKTSFSISVQSTTEVEHHFRIVLNGVEIDPVLGSGPNLMTSLYGVPTSFFREGANTLQLFAMNGASDVGFLESIRINHARLYVAKDNQLSFHTKLYRASNLQGFTSSNIRVFDLNYPDSPNLVSNPVITQDGGNYSVRLPANRSSVMYAVEDSAISQPASITPNVPSTLFTGTYNANFIIITHKNFVAEANTWAAYRQSQGLTVKVVDIEDIYDEFSFGAQNTVGIRSFLQHTNNNWQARYVLILGDAYWDYRNYEGSIHTNYVPTKMVDTVYMETGSDETLADFNDDGLAEIAIGRIPARDAATVTQAFNKMTAFELTVSQWSNRGAVFVADLPIGYDFAAMNERIRLQLPQNMTSVMITRADCVNPPPPVGQTTVQCLEAQRANVRAELSTGKYIVNYAGHGSTGFWAVSNPVNFFNNSDAMALTNGTNYSFYTMLTCLNGYFMGGNDSLAESLMKSPNGGAVASWTSTGKTTPDVQEIMATRFYGQLTAGNMPRVGDLIKDAKTSIGGGRDVLLSWALVGDPGMKLR